MGLAASGNRAAWEPPLLGAESGPRAYPKSRAAWGFVPVSPRRDAELARGQRLRAIAAATGGQVVFANL